MMQVNFKNAFNNVFQATIFRELCDGRGPLTSIIPFTKLFYGTHSSLYYQHGQHAEGITIIESTSGMRQDDPLGGLLFALAHYRALLETIAWASNYIFPSLMGDTHIMGPLNEIIHAFDHLST